ncbi:MAG: response regulator, partial [Paenibacillus sp.]|nr:response regulator [Paenibacillus sp.]
IYDWFKGWIPLYLEYLKLSTGRRWRKEIQAVANMIQQQYHLPLKVPELAKEVGFTENYLSILFKKETGETIMDYITHTRMKKARELMKDPSFKIYEISEMVGYGDSNHFSKIFKRVEGVYPTEFRKMFLGR